MSDELQKPDQPSIQEPSVLDYVKSRFRFGGERIQIPESVEDEKPSAVNDQQLADSSPEIHPSTPFPWRSLLALLFALIGQNTFEPPPSTSPLGIAFYVAAFALLGWAIYRGEWFERSSGEQLAFFRRALGV